MRKVIPMMRIFCLLLLAIFVNTRSVAQTELTTEMVWQEGTHWIYPVFVPYDDYDGTPLNITYLHECRLVKRYYKELDDYYLVLEHRTNDPMSSNGANWYNYLANLKVEGNKVYEFIIRDGSYGEPFTVEGKCLMYDFDAWVEGGIADFEYDKDFDDIHSVHNVSLENMQRIVTDPEGKYYSYAFSGEYNYIVFAGNKYNPRIEETVPYCFVKSIGRLIDNMSRNLAYSHWPFWYQNPWREFGSTEGIMAIKIWHPDLGVLYQHPEYDRYVELASVEHLTADEAGEAVVTAGSGEVTVESVRPVDVMICTTTGVTVRRDKVTGSATYSLAPGIYIVRAGSRTCKICI